jgi:hypothetical protein
MALAAGVLVIGSGPAQAAPTEARVTVTRATDGHEPGSLRAALDGATTRPDQSVTIILTAPLYELSACGASDDDTDVSGDLDVRTAAPVRIVGARGGTTIRQQCPDRVLDQLGTGPLTLVDITVTGGSVRGTDPSDVREVRGGGIRAGAPSH